MYKLTQPPRLANDKKAVFLRRNVTVEFNLPRQSLGWAKTPSSSISVQWSIK
jgi:hypothetical protein